jgi:F-type H+-transporting ATPase subunit delta
MSNETVARRYATALADVVTNTGETETIKAELKQWQTMFETNPELSGVFANPSVTHENKERILNDLIAKTKPSGKSSNFLKALAHNGRLEALGEVNDWFAKVIDERSGFVTAAITSARDLPPAERAEFKKNLEKLTGKRVSIEFEVDKEIIGGAVTRIGSTVYDGSVRTKLENLKEQMIGM